MIHIEKQEMWKDNIKAIRKALGMTQSRLAELLGVVPYTIRRWESGISKPSPLALDKLKKVAEDGIKDSQGRLAYLSSIWTKKG